MSLELREGERCLELVKYWNNWWWSYPNRSFVFREVERERDRTDDLMLQVKVDRERVNAEQQKETM